ncbi:MAG: AAA family ATPase [candidate division WOR-3 bacterium]|nr:AAA family ATPase [candidate division WOR-3 bacterium]MCX7948099.1 AAA family ATPase [candidate division WOR-3 bacterium]MDW8150823.1 AAA family ATPase [candidate division WOR-3 bacterium]
MEWKKKKLSESAKIILEEAEKIARKRNESIVDTDHLLYALFTANSKNPFAKWLEKKGISIEQARREIQRTLNAFYSQLESLIQSYRRSILELENQIAYNYSNSFAKEIINKFLHLISENIENYIIGKRERDFVQVKIQRWIPTTTRSIFRNILEEFFSDLEDFLFPDITSSSWTLKEQTISVPKKLIDSIREIASKYGYPNVDELIPTLADYEDKIRSSLIHLYDNGIDPRRIIYALSKSDKFQYSIFLQNILNKIASEKDEISANDIIEELASSKTVGGNILSQLLNMIKETIRTGSWSEELKEEEKSALERWTIDITQLAKENKLDPVIGREREIEQLIEILGRKQKNNPVLVGPAGVGKTAIVEGLAQKIVKAEVPEFLKDKKILQLDVGALIAGTKYRGEMEERTKQLLEELKSREDILLFIDEIHTIVGAGRAEGAPLDLSNMLKPLLARGEIRLIGATTPDEYRNYIEKDSALERRFQPIWVDEPDYYSTIEILKGLRKRYEEYHKVKINDGAIETAVKLSSRYIQGRKLPDKAIDVLDRACSRKKLKVLYNKPTKEKITAEIEKIEREISKLVEEKNFEKAEELKRIKEQLDQKLKELENVEKSDQELERKIVEIEEKMKDAEKRADIESWEKYSEELKLLKKELLSRKKEKSSEIIVDEEDVAEVVSEITGIPLQKMMEEEKKKLLYMEDYLHQRIINQEEAVKAVSEAIRRARAGISEPKRPLGSFLFLGPTGVGKTELSKALAEFLFGSEDALIRLDMSEFKEEHSVSKLIGAPPGYVGYEEGGKLTEAVRRKPYSVILLDEIEKAHPRIFDLFLQVLDDGRLTDSQGRTVSFRNTVIIMTSNLGSDFIREFMETYSEKFKKAYKSQVEDIENLMKEFNMEFEVVKERVLEVVKRFFRPEFINRIDEIVVFKPLLWKEIVEISKLLINRLKARLKEQNVELEVDEKALELLSIKGFDPILGARPLRRVIQKDIENEISKLILSGKLDSKNKIKLSADGERFILEVM